MQITVMGVREVANSLYQEPDTFSHLVSLLSPDHARPKEVEAFPCARLFLEFDDISNPASAEKYKSMGYFPPEPEHAHAIQDFANVLPADANILVHCAAGISRSTAAAIIIARTAMFSTDQEAVDYVFSIRPQAAPNEILLGYADRANGWNLAETVRSKFEGEYYV